MEAKSPYRTAKELGIEQWERDGLVALVGPLSRGELALNMNRETGFNDGGKPICGTCHCIGGWIAFLNGRKSVEEIRVYVEKYLDTDGRYLLTDLFWPGESGSWKGYEASAPQAARAIINFLMTGSPQWDAVMSRSDPA